MSGSHQTRIESFGVEPGRFSGLAPAQSEKRRNVVLNTKRSVPYPHKAFQALSFMSKPV
jgi:hypothetical protein